MPTMRLEVELPEDATLEWNFMQEAAKAGYDIFDENGEPYVVMDETVGQENGDGPAAEGGEEGEDASNHPDGGGTPGDAFGGPPGFADGDAEAIAAALDAKWGDYGKSKKKKKFLKVCDQFQAGALTPAYEVWTSAATRVVRLDRRLHR